jgi:hypothetical protein
MLTEEKMDEIGARLWTFLGIPQDIFLRKKREFRKNIGAHIVTKLVQMKAYKGSSSAWITSVWLLLFI